MCDKIVDTYEYRPLVLDYDVEDIRRRYLKLYAGLIFDSMEELGIMNQAMDSGIYPLLPDMKVAGPAFTATRQVKVDFTEQEKNTRIGLVKSMIPGCIFISDSGGNSNSAHFGEITATCYRAAGCAGAVMDGSVRDTNYLINMGFPTFSRFRNPVEGHGRSEMVDFMVPIYVKGIEGMLKVYPGDFVFGDNDGVVIVPKDMTVPVLEQAEHWVETEKLSRKAMEDGMNPLDVYNTYGRF